MKREYKYKEYTVIANSKKEAVTLFNDIIECEALGMSTLYSDETGLDVPVWVDENKTYKSSGHGKRIKFKAGINQTNTRNFSTMKLDNQEIVEESLPKKKSDRYSSRVYDEIKNWVFNNNEALSCLSDRLISLNQFKQAMIKGKQKASQNVILKHISIVEKLKNEFSKMLNKKVEMEK